MKNVFCLDCGFNLDFLGSRFNWCEGCDNVICDDCIYQHNITCELIVNCRLVN